MIRASLALPLCLLSVLAPAAADPLQFGSGSRFLALRPFVQADLAIATDVPAGFPTDRADLNVARLYAEARHGRLGARFSYDFQDEARVTMAYASYSPTDRIEFRLGQQDEPFSLVDLSGRRAQTMIDGNEAVALAPGDNVGIVAVHDGERHTLSAGLFGGDLQTGVGAEGLAVAGRAVWNPTGRGERLTHLAIAAARRSGRDLRAGFVSQVGANLLPRELVSVGAFEDVDRLDRLNLEGAFRFGSVSAQSEVTFVAVDRRTGSDESPLGVYLLGSWILTGEIRPYAGGSFGQIVPDRPVFSGGYGAWELAARMDGTDTDGGGRTLRGTLGLNWHLSRRLRLGLNASHTDIEGSPSGLSSVSGTFLRLQYAH
ncbi:OprO/OprP family phosphate-selective porin [Parvularcula oceani]|uniref:OprO/OprP family phosphate-selective porin n=1 Tax=Parvularcula oceani TaxID=1247963 RepID=UPI0004E13BAA|nr:porin [Parvularcula oceani]